MTYYTMEHRQAVILVPLFLGIAGSWNECGGSCPSGGPRLLGWWGLLCWGVLLCWGWGGGWAGWWPAGLGRGRLALLATAAPADVGGVLGGGGRPFAGLDWGVLSIAGPGPLLGRDGSGGVA